MLVDVVSVVLFLDDDKDDDDEDEDDEEDDDADDDRDAVSSSLPFANARRLSLQSLASTVGDGLFFDLLVLLV